MTKEKKTLILGILEIVISIFITLSIISYSNNDYLELIKKGFINGNFKNYTGGIGCFLSHWILILTGYCSIFVILLIAQLGIYNIISTIRGKKYSTAIKILILFIILSIFLNSIEIIHHIKTINNFHLGGLLFYKIAKYITILFGNVGTYLIMILLTTIYLIITIEKTFDIKPPAFINSIDISFKKLFKKENKNEINIIDISEKKKTKTNIKNDEKKIKKDKNNIVKVDNINMEELTEKNTIEDISDDLKINTESELSEGLLKAMEKIEDVENSSTPYLSSLESNIENKTMLYKLPELNLLPDLEKNNTKISKLEISQTSQKLESKLQEFGVNCKVVAVSPGPIITLYELKLAPGIKVNKVMQLVDDLSLALTGRRVRVIAPIPGKETIGIEVPNTNPEIVFFKEILTSPIFKENKNPLLIALGKNIAGKPFATSLTKMPHLLIAGATGSGKSVCLNSIIASLLFTNTPDDLRLLLIDPKMIEFSIYQDIPHLLTPVVTDPKNAITVLQWAVLEMENRYKMLAKYGSRNIIDFNNKATKIKKEDKNADIERLNYIVIIIDELADLMMTASADIETSIARLAQMARAVGIHLILATQRPSVNVITGVIKANLPA